jgi:hypothetical protein
MNGAPRKPKHARERRDLGRPLVVDGGANIA